MDDSGTRVCLITGATGAIGKAIARQIALRPGTEVVLALNPSTPEYPVSM